MPDWLRDAARVVVSIAYAAVMVIALRSLTHRIQSDAARIRGVTKLRGRERGEG